MRGEEMTEELKNDLRIVKMRAALDPKRFYKHNDMKALPKFVQASITMLMRYIIYIYKSI